MSYISFYRKWRPQSFSEIIGQEHVVQTLRNSVLKNRISHSYIFCGPRGTGKTSMARIFAKALNCVNGPTSDPCNKCNNCTSISAGTNVDVIEIDAASNRGIDDIRDLREKVKYLPVILRKKVYIIDEAHQITSAASNAFLKVLEEPPEHVVFIMATTEPHEVIPTIMSRCQRFDFEPLKLDKIKARLSDIASSEGININESAINLIAKYADGSLRDADGILEQLSSFGDSKITVDNITSLLGIIDQEMLFEFTNILIEKNTNQGLLFIKRLMESGLNLKIFVTELLEHLYNLYVIKSYENPLDIIDVNEDAKGKYFNQSSLFNIDEIEMYLDIFSELLKQVKWGEGAKTFFKTAVIKAINSSVINETNINSRFKKIDSELNELKQMLKESTNVNNECLKEKDAGMLITNNKDLQQKTVKNSGTGRKSSIEKESSEASRDNLALQPEKAINAEEIEKFLRSNYDKLTALVKKKSISLEAVFKEATDFNIKGNNTIYFYLSEKKKFHKDHLNKVKNATVIQESLKEITGRNMKVVFDFEEDNNNTEIKDNDNIITEKKNAKMHADNFEEEATSNDDIIEPEKNTVKEQKKPNEVKGNKTSAENDIYDYIETKFGKKIIK